LLRQWQQRYGCGRPASVLGTAAVPAAGAEADEVERLRARNAQLEREVEVLKKAIEICSRR
jgi:transposase-like protein